ncbi:hypothetical protein BC937DRAFT_87882 [Endogone sp. FLAS-F59071]|nr:hypothetical protein BC937DRAFT_87882 [Endogone sp. FLAS-F59071]|eukprot:RUS19181.1 hypothetical protein BC937DRAFT_87882 [Endogone sp. FLAS-F59071]
MESDREIQFKVAYNGEKRLMTGWGRMTYKQFLAKVQAKFRTQATNLFSFDNKGDRITIDADDDIYNALKHTDFPEFLLEDPDCWFLEAENGVIVKKEPERQDPSPEPLGLRAPVDLPQLEEPDVQDQAIEVNYFIPSRLQSHPSTYEVDDSAEAGPSRAPALEKGKRPLYPRLVADNRSKIRLARRIRSVSPMLQSLASPIAPKKSVCTSCHFTMHDIRSHIKGSLAAYGSVGGKLTRISIKPELNPKLPNSLLVVGKRKLKLCMSAMTSGVKVPLFVHEGPDRWLFCGIFQVVNVRPIEEDSVCELFREDAWVALTKSQRTDLISQEKEDGPFYHVVLKLMDADCPILLQRPHVG